MAGLFLESEELMIRRTGINERRCDRLRRALIMKRTGELRDVPYQIQAMEQEEIEALFGIIWDGKQGVYVPDPTFKPDEMEVLKAQVRSMFGSTDANEPGARREIRIQRGLPINQPSFGFVAMKDTEGETTGVERTPFASLIAQAFEIACRKGYIDGGVFLNEHGIYSPRSGKPWNKDTARDLFRNPEYAGYPRSKSERTSMTCYPGSYEPIVPFQTWIDANRSFIRVNYDQITFLGWRSTEDERAWQDARS